MKRRPQAGSVGTLLRVAVDIDGTAEPWTVTANSSPGRCIALTCGRFFMWRNRTRIRWRSEVESATKKDAVNRSDDRSPTDGDGRRASRRIPSHVDDAIHLYDSGCHWRASANTCTSTQPPCRTDLRKRGIPTRDAQGPAPNLNVTMTQLTATLALGTEGMNEEYGR